MSREQRIPILLYHKVGHPPRGARVPGHYVSPGLFRRHLACLRRLGYESIPAEAVVATEPPLPVKPVVITFDDGYRCLHELALPPLVEFGFRATVFMVAAGIGGTNSWEAAVGDVEEPMLGSVEIAEMQAAGVSFGSHTLSHPHLTELSDEQVRTELTGSRVRLSELLGTPCLGLAYPYGDWDRRVRDLAAEAGYEVAFTTARAAARPVDDPLALPRINVRRYNVTPRFALKLWRAMQARA
jgi:peptidoglycan/xylan/chitin deacetylase (PgdA/CDA1 family)